MAVADRVAVEPPDLSSVEPNNHSVQGDGDIDDSVKVKTQAPVSVENVKEAAKLIPGITAEDLTDISAIHSDINILIAGQTGAGKSTFLNGFVGQKLFEEGDDLNVGTKEMEFQSFTRNGVNFRVWDTPGLEDGSGNETEYLENMRKVKGVHLFLYCISMKEKRPTLDRDESTLTLLTKTLGTEIWRHSVVVLTYANNVERGILKGRDKQSDHGREFKRQLELWEDVIKEALVKAGVDKSIISKIPIQPAGFYKKPRLQCVPENEAYWLSTIWQKALERMKDCSQPCLLLANLNRLHDKKDVKDADFVDNYNQPIIIPTALKVGAAAGAVSTGAVTGAGVGATIGALVIGVPSFGLAAGLGLFIGGLVGGSIGGTATAGVIALVKFFREKRKAMKEKYAETIL